MLRHSSLPLKVLHSGHIFELHSFVDTYRPILPRTTQAPRFPDTTFNMKIPANLLDTNGKPAEGYIGLLGGDGQQTPLEEFGYTQDVDTFSCYVLTSPGDVLSLKFALQANLAVILVEGILRNSIQNKTTTSSSSTQVAASLGKLPPRVPRICRLRPWLH